VLGPLLVASLGLLLRAGWCPQALRLALIGLEPFQHLIVLFLALLPVAITMSLTWKIKDAILVAVFGDAT
jgi:hypothetical protein